MNTFEGGKCSIVRLSARATAGPPRINGIAVCSSDALALEHKPQIQRSVGFARIEVHQRNLVPSIAAGGAMSLWVVTLRVGPRTVNSHRYDYNPKMKRFAIEHLPRAVATYHVSPVGHIEARAWLEASEVTSLIRTTELIHAVSAGFGVTLEQAATSMALEPGDEALLLSLSFSVQLAWAQGRIVPLPEDWRCLLLRVEALPTATLSGSAAIAQDRAQVRRSEIAPDSRVGY